ncbi:MAG: HRDC domain-containing protein [Planctomycetia bacterium]
MSYLEITTDAQLIRYCHRLAKCRTIAIDTEFVSEDTFRPELCLIQVAADGELTVIDPVAIKDIRPFWVVLAAEGHETIVHAARSEVEFCLDAIGRPPAGLLDVQIGAGLAGLEYPTSYGSLISRLLKKKLGKHETRTDWRRRPLSTRQIDYALDDVRHLAEIRNILGQKLDAAGRSGWWADEMNRWLDDLYKSRDNDPWRRVSGNSGLDPRSLAILRELYAWRNEEAAHKNRPAKRILRDDLLVEIAKQKTADARRLRRIRGMERYKKQLDEILERIEIALELPDDKCPRQGRSNRTPQLSVLGQILFAALGSVCRKQRLAPSLVATPNEIRYWFAYRTNPEQYEDAPPPALNEGWRAEVVGNLFEDLLSGKKRIRITDPTSDFPLDFEDA